MIEKGDDEKKNNQQLKERKSTTKTRSKERISQRIKR
jgi:hypothetical protein